MNKIIIALFGAIVLSSVLYAPVFAEETITTVQTLIQQLQQQIEQLQTQIKALQQTKGEIKETISGIKGTLKLLGQLREGMTSEDVKLLQEILATDPDIYPEGFITGYFGSLTKNAVKRFQKIAGFEQVGNVGPKTLSKLNELLAEGAGNSGKVPPGLLIAPGIRKKVDLELLKPLPGQKLPPGIAKKLDGVLPGQDITPPVISEVKAVNITETSAKITWITNEKSDSKVWYDKTTPLVVTDMTPASNSSDLVLSHEILLSGLTADTAYYFKSGSVDEAKNSSTSAENSFTTL